MTQETKTYLSLKLATAHKASLRATGDITYRVLCDEKRHELFIAIVSNDGGGYFSREMIPYAAVEKCLANFNDGQPLPSKVLRDAFVGKSANNAGFLAAILRAEGLLAPVPDAAHKHQVIGDWAGRKVAMLSADGEIYVPETKPDASGQANSSESADSAVQGQEGEGLAATQSGNAEGEPEILRRKGRGSKAHPVGLVRKQESDNASPA